MWDARKLGGIYKTFGKSTLNNSKFIQCFNQLNSSHKIYYCEKFK